MATIIKNETSFSREIRINVDLLKLSGTIPPEDKTPPKMFLSYCLTVIALTGVLIQTSIYVYNLFVNAAYIETAIESFALAISFSGGLIRNSLVYWSREKVQGILNTLEDLWKILNSQERRQVSLYIKSTRNLTYFFMSQCIFTIFFYGTSALFVNSFDGDTNATRVLPYAFFVEVYRSPYYEITYFFQIFSMFNVGFTCVGADMAGPLLINTVCGHFKVIQERLKNLDYRVKIENCQITEESVHQVHKSDYQTTEEGAKNRENHSLESLSSELRSCVNYHRKILTICSDIEELTSIIFLTQLIGSTYILSAVGFKLVGDDQDKYKYFAQIIIGIVQLLICNWPPDALLTESQGVADAFHFAPWYQWPNGLKKSVLIIILRAQNPVRLTAGKFVHLSLETFASMISTAVSFFTMLRSFN